MATIDIAAQLVALGAQIAPGVIEAVKAEMAISGTGQAPTPNQQAEIDAGLQAAHAALQAAQQQP